MTEGGGKKKPLDIIDHMTEHLSSYDGRYLVIPGTSPAYPSYYPYIHQPFLYTQPQIHPRYIAHRGYGSGGEAGGCLIENMVGNWSPDLTGTYSPFGGGVPPQPPPQGDQEQQPFDQVLSPQSQAPGPIQSHIQGAGQIPHSVQVPSSPHHQLAPKKHRIVAEVKPLRPSYSDVVSKSSAPPLSPSCKAPPQPIKSPVQPVQVKEATRVKSKVAPTQPNNFHGQGVKEKEKKDSLSDDIMDVKKSRKQQDWTDRNSEQVKSKQSQPSKKKVKQNVHEEKSKTAKTLNQKSPNCHSNAGDSYRKYVAVSDDEPDDDDGDESDETVGEQNTSQPRQRLHHETSTSRKHSGVKVERTVNAPRSSGKSKRSQRFSKRKESKLGILCRVWQEKCSYYLILITTWLINLLVDVIAMSTALLVQLGVVLLRTLVDDFRALAGWLKNIWSRGEDSAPPLPPQNSGHTSLQQNIQLPTTGEEAMKRLLSCKGKDPYSILGLTSNCTDEEIRRYYRSQALLVHPDKNSQPGAEEAFKILVHAFDLIAEPEKRAAYDRYVSETNQVEQAWSELNDLLTQLHEKMHYAATTIRCNNCGKRHKRTLTERPVYAARYCAQCNIHHSAKEGDMWCEVGRWLFSRRYLACMEGSVYEITDWAKCQGGGLNDLVPHAHSVHYRVLLGGVDRNNHTTSGDAEFEDLLSSIYGQSGNQSRHRGHNRRKGKKTK